MSVRWSRRRQTDHGPYPLFHKSESQGAALLHRRVEDGLWGNERFHHGANLRYTSPDPLSRLQEETFWFNRADTAAENILMIMNTLHSMWYLCRAGCMWLMCHLAQHKPPWLHGKWICSVRFHSDMGTPHLEIETVPSVYMFYTRTVSCKFLSVTNDVIPKTQTLSPDKTLPPCRCGNISHAYFSMPFLNLTFQLNTVLLIASVTFNPQRYDNILILDAIDQLTAIHATVFQLKMTKLQRGVHGVSLSKGSPWSKMAIWLRGMCIWYHDNILWPYVSWLQFCPFHFITAGLGPQNTRQGDIMSPSANDLGVHRRVNQILQLLGC